MAKEYSKINVYPETHRKVRILAAILDMNIADLMDMIVNEATDDHSPTPQEQTEVFDGGGVA